MDKKRYIVISIFIIFFIIAIIISDFYYSDKFSVTFSTGTSDIILTKYVSKNCNVSEPAILSKEGYVFKEWQLNGEKYNFDEIVTQDIVLTAKWVKEEYITIKYNTNSDYEIEDKKILKGDKIDSLPNSYKDNYEFIGWYLNQNIYNDEEIYSDVTLNAHYKNEVINTTYGIGDKVIIIGNYSASAYSKFGNNKRAIGWERKIINIIDDSEFPYVVGDDTGVTGFFKASSIDKKENK